MTNAGEFNMGKVLGVCVVSAGLLLAACGHNVEERAATGAITGAVVGGPVGAAAGAAVGTAVSKSVDK
jgi:outer membrane lipoprotein SlyB